MDEVGGSYPGGVFELGGFSPIIDDVARDVGFMTAAVYGVVWRHCRMKVDGVESGVCWASRRTLANLIQVSEKTVERHLTRLVEAGYLADLDPGKRNAPHRYKCTGKTADIRAWVGFGQTESRTNNRRSDTESHHGQTQSLNGSDRESVDNTKGRRQREETTSGVGESLARLSPLIRSLGYDLENQSALNDLQAALAENPERVETELNALIALCRDYPDKVHNPAGAFRTALRGGVSAVKWLSSLDLSLHLNEPGDRALHDRLEPEAIAGGCEGGPTYFRTLEQRGVWRAASGEIIGTCGLEELERTIDSALLKGVRSLDRVIDYVAVWADELADGSSPAVEHDEDTAVCMTVPNLIPDEDIPF